MSVGSGGRRGSEKGGKSIFLYYCCIGIVFVGDYGTIITYILIVLLFFVSLLRKFEKKEGGV